MPSIADPARLSQLERRLAALRPGSVRRWGTLTPAEMLCHLSDSTAHVLGSATREPGPSRPLFRWLALRTGLPWPRGRPTMAHLDPRREGTRPDDLERDRRRVLEGLRAVAAAAPGMLPASHFVFGAMRHEDWGYWAYRHTDHHLRQFGL